MEEQQNQQKASNPKKNNEDLKKAAKNHAKNYLKYSSMAFQMAAIIFLGTFGGYKLDQYLSLETPVFTLILSILSVITAIYFAIKDFIKK